MSGLFDTLRDWFQVGETAENAMAPAIRPDAIADDDGAWTTAALIGGRRPAGVAGSDASRHVS